jgi:hypothetical protein
MWKPIGFLEDLPSRRALHVGVRLGPPSHHSSFAVIETNADDVLKLLHLERHSGTYPKIVEKLENLLGRLPETEIVALDVTVVGRAVTDLFLRAEIDAAISARTVVESRTEASGYNVKPSVDLISNLVVLFQTGNLRIPSDLSHAKELEKALATTRADGSAVDDRESDLIFAVAWAADLAQASLAGDREFEAYARAYGLDPDEIRRQARQRLNGDELPDGVYQDEVGNTLTVRGRSKR